MEFLGNILTIALGLYVGQILIEKFKK